MPSNKISSCSEEVRRGPWTFEEDSLLIQYITSHGEGRWNLVAKSSGLKRTGKSCRLRWLNYLKPDIKRGNLTPQEQLLILDLHSKWGNRWSKIAAELPGRTDNEIKNYWRTRVQRQARQLKIDSNSNKFIETLKHLWMPRLVEEMDQKPQSSSSFSSANTQNSETPSLLTISAPSENQMKFPNQPKIEKSTCLSEKECYHVDIGSLDVEDFNELVKGSDEISMSDCQIEGIDWINSEIASPFWNMDQLWEVNK